MSDPRSARYKWIVLSNTTLAILLATLDASITIIAMPAIFRGIHLDPLQPGNSFYLLWMVLGYIIVGSVLIVSFGRLGDMFGRVRMYNLGFVIYTAASLALTVCWLTGTSGAMYLVVFRLVQGVGGAFLIANSAAILTDAFPPNQRGMALGINNIVGVSGMFVGLVLGGILAPISWRLVFLISVPVGLFGTVWAYLKLQELSRPVRAKIDWLGNVTFALGLILIMIAITHGIRPYGNHSTGWLSPQVLIEMACGVASLIAFAVVELRSTDPMFRLPLLRIRAFTFGTLSTFLAALARGGLMFMLIIWLQGIWLPLHGVDFADTPLQAGLFMLPLTIGLLRRRTDLRRTCRTATAPRPFATGGMLLAAVSFGLLLLMPTDFSYPVFALRPADERDLDGAVRVAQPRGGDELAAARRPRQRRRHECDLPELGPGAVGRDLLLADDRRPGHAACHTRSPRACTLTACRRPPRPPRVGSRRCRSCSPRSSATTRFSTSSVLTCWDRCRPTPRRC